MKNKSPLPILILLSFFLGCEARSQKEELSSLLGSWDGQFEYEYRPEIVIDGIVDASNIKWSSVIEFYPERFTINLGPPVQSQLWWHDSRSQLFGDYIQKNDTLYFSIADSSALDDPYLFKVAGDTLYLSMVYKVNEKMFEKSGNIRDDSLLLTCVGIEAQGLM
ncbi:MAG: hypothetical protein K9N35_05025 [Candidatus Marinimicrobia bacterium]|nr:hypothetical protein [Candidatus Neomarinimicrobiota bacterium]